MASIDTVIFDVDGVLWAAQDAYNRCTLYVARKLAHQYNWDLAGLSLEHIAAFKRSGGFNSDWDMVWAIVTLLQARTEGRIPPGRSWFDLADENGGQGLAWVQSYVGAAPFDYQQLQKYYNAHYWGADMYPAIYDAEPVVAFEPGFAQAERPFARPDLAARLRAAGVRQIGIITGRNRNEMRSSMAVLDFDGLLVPDAIYTDEDGHKPSPELLERAIARLQTDNAVMVGDSIDDLRLVLNYRQLPPERQTARVQFVAIDHDHDPERWRSLGADAVLQDVNELPDLLRN